MALDTSKLNGYDVSLLLRDCQFILDVLLDRAMALVKLTKRSDERDTHRIPNLSNRHLK